MFTQASQTDCPITNCALYEKGCTKPLVTTYLTIGTSAKLWPFSAKTGLKMGYVVENFCVKCGGEAGDSGLPEAKIDDLNVK